MRYLVRVSLEANRDHPLAIEDLVGRWASAGGIPPWTTFGGSFRIGCGCGVRTADSCAVGSSPSGGRNPLEIDAKFYLLNCPELGVSDPEADLAAGSKATG